MLQGRRYGLASVAGVALGNFGNAVGAAVGLAALFAVSSLAFTVVNYAGAGYLIYLGVQALRAPATTQSPVTPKVESVWRIFRDGFVVALLNPKTAIFFAAFLPQFMSTSAPLIPQSIALGALFVAVAAISDTVYALSAVAIAPLLRGAGRGRSVGRYVTGASFIGLGLLTALSDSKARTK